MIKVLIVDDELLIRVGVKSCIDWEANGFEVVGLAEDGKQALEMIGGKKPEIVLTDIKMPNMDGLELIERIKKEFPQIRVIVLSCYNELDFIKRAMKMGADDYILKLSMEPADLLNVLNGVKAAIGSAKEALQQQAAGSKKEIRMNRNFIKEDLYKRAVDRSISGERLVRELKELGSGLSFSKAGLICAGIDDYTHASIRSRMEDQYLLKIAVINIMEEILGAYCSGDVVEIVKGKFLVVVEYAGSGENYESLMKEFCQRVDSAMENYLNISVSFGISTLLSDVNSFSSRCAESLKALEQRFYTGKKSTAVYGPNTEFSDKMISLSFDEEKILAACLENLNDERAKAILEGFFGGIRHLGEYHPSKVRTAAVEILHSFIKVAKKFEIEAEFDSSSQENKESALDILLGAETLADIETWFSAAVDRFIDCLSNKRLSMERPEILKLKQYIADRIYDEITLDMAASFTCMSKSYLSTVFKKETGEAFTDYVNRLKIEEAKNLIQRQGLKSYEAAERLGFNDESYFSKLFKKYIGVSPSRVRI